MNSLLLVSICLGFAACNSQTGHHSPSEKIATDSNTTVTDSLPLTNSELTTIYSQAIAEFIKAAYIHDKITFDTLYFGKHVYRQPDDFPDITLPQTIEKTQIRLVTPEAGQKLQAARTSLVYVNMMSWIDNSQADFMLVVFSNGAIHQYDYFINFNYSNSTNKFVLETIAVEYFLNANGQKPKRIAIYQDGNYVGNK